MPKMIRKTHGDKQAKGEMNPESGKDSNETHRISIPSKKRNPFMSPALEEHHRFKLLQYHQGLRVMPFVEVAYWTSRPDDRFLLQMVDTDGNDFTVGAVLDFAPKNCGVRLQVGPGLLMHQVVKMVTAVAETLKHYYVDLGAEIFQTLKTEQKQLKKNGTLPV